MRPVRKTDNLTTSQCRRHEISEPNFLEPSGPLHSEIFHDILTVQTQSQSYSSVCYHIAYS